MNKKSRVLFEGCPALVPATVLMSLALSAGPAYGGFGKPALQGERLGLASGDDFELVTGRCDGCPISPAALWYFQDELIAVPRHAGRFSPFVWIGAPEIVEHATISADPASPHGLRMTLDGRPVPLALVPKLVTNRSYYDATTTAYFAGRLLRIRGTTDTEEGEGLFVARTIWPEDFRLRPESLFSAPMEEDRTLGRLITGQMEGLRGEPYRRLLWERELDRPRAWGGRPVLAFVLSGAQGDDDDAHWGHLAVATGYVGAEGEWEDWLVYNFYPLNKVSEKGIETAMVPMDNYLADLNRGQAYYRPSYVAVAVLREDRVPRIVGASIRQIMHDTYCHRVTYDQATMNSTSLPMDTLRRLGWQIPDRGRTGFVKALGGFLYVAATQWSFQLATDLFRALMEETTRILPRPAFEALTLDLLRLVREPLDDTRSLTAFEQMLREDTDAVLFVRIPQIPSSRAFGTYPVASFEEFLHRVSRYPEEWERMDAPRREPPLHLHKYCLSATDTATSGHPADTHAE